MTHARPMAVCGWHACLALFERRPDAIRRILIAADKQKLLGHILSWAAARRLPYRTIQEAELAKAAGTPHHEGVVILADEKPVLPAEDLARAPVRPDAFVLVLESVANPHNLGAMLRSCAFFGASTVVLAGDESPRKLSPAVMRTSQGGAEHVELYRADEIVPLLAGLKRKGFAVVGTDVFGKDLTGAVPETAPTGLIMGSERGGMSPAVRAACDRLVRIPGSDAVESLNVSVACGILLALFVGLGARAGGPQ
ncbi:MAG: RNA methyltransferase, partial [Planctomycetes bacterium]|nr:RNA methyltransferase [Planctomycetota bacterium]